MVMHDMIADNVYTRKCPPAMLRSNVAEKAKRGSIMKKRTRFIAAIATAIAAAPAVLALGEGTADATPAYSVPQLEGIWVASGGSVAHECVAAAVATAESGGDPSAISPTGDYGLWQINKAAWGSLATLSVSGSAHSAILISNDGANWDSWATYNSGMYIQYMSQCKSGVRPPVAPAPPASHKAHPTTVADEPEVRVPPSGSEYTVREGDWLSKIARQHDVAGGWQELYALNEHVIGGNPDLIFPGQVIRL